MPSIRERFGRGNAKGIVGSIIAAVILVGIFIEPLNSAAFTVNFTPVDPASITQPLQSNAPPLDFNIGIQLNPAEQLIVQELQIVVDGQSGSPLRFQDTGAPIGSPDPRISLQQGSNFPAKNTVSMGGGSGGYGYSYSVVSGQGFIGPVTLPYILKVFPNQLAAGPHSILVQIKAGTGAVTPSGVINFSIGGNFGSSPALGGQASPPSISVPPAGGSSQVTITLNSINNLHASSPTIELQANPFPGSQITFSGTGVSGNTVVLNAQTKTVTMTVSTTNVIPGQYNIFFKAKVQGQNIEFPLNIPVSVVASNTPTLILNPQTVNPGSSVTFDGFNFSPGTTVSLSVLIPGAGTQSLTVSQYTVGQGTNNAQVASDGRIQGTTLIPSSAIAGTYPVTMTASDGKTAQASISIFTAGASDFQLSVSPQVLNLPPPPPPGQAQDPSTLQSMEVSFSKIGSFNSAVTIQVQGLPPGVSTTFDSNNDNTYSPSENTIQPPSVGTTSQPLRIKFISTSSTPFGFFPVSIQGSSGATFKFVQAQISIPPPQSFQGSGSSGIGVLSLNPPAGSTGTTVSFNGITPSGLTGKSVAIRIAEDPTNLATATVGSSNTFSGSFTVPSSFVGVSGTITSPSGNFPIKAIITDGPTLFADFTILSASASFRTNISPRDLPPVQTGSDSNTLTVSATSLPGKAGGTVNVAVRGLPPNMTVKFDGGAFSSTTTSTMSLPAGGTVSKSIQFRAASNTPPGPVPLFIEVSSGSEVYGFPLPFGVVPNASFTSTFGFASVFLSKQTGRAGDDVTVTASGFQANSALTIIFGGLSTDPSFSATADSSGGATVPIKVPSSLQPGTYPVRVRDAVNKEAAQPFTIAGSADTFSLTVSPSFLPPIEQGANPSPNTATVTVSVFSGKSLPANPVVSIRGLPPGVQAKFDSGAFSSAPTKTLTGINSGGTASTVLSFKASDSAPPGPINAFVEVTAGSEKRGQPLNSGIVPKANFLSFGPPSAGGFNAFDVGTVFLTPNSVSAGDAVTVTASGFTPNATPIIEVMTFPTPTAINLPTGTTFDSSGAFSSQVRVPSSLSSGQYEFEVREQGSTRFASARLTVVGTGDVFSLNVSPQFLPPAPQGGQSEPIQITASALSGKNAGTVTLSISGLPRGVTSSFDGTTGTQTTLSVGTGGTASSQLIFNIDSKTPPGPVNLVLRATTSASGSQTVIIPIDFGVRPDVAFINFGAGLAPGAFNPFSFGSLILNPNSGAAGDSLTVSASGFTPSATISSLNFGGTSIPLPSGTTFDSTGSFTQSIKVPTLSAGVYPVSISDANGRNAVADFRVVSSSATMTLKVSPQFIPPAPQGQTLGQSDETTITISALAGRTPGTVTLNLRGLPPGVTSHFNTGSGYSSTGSTSATVTVGAGASTEVKLKFVVSQNTPPGPVPLFLEATTSTETLGTPLPFGIRPSNTFASLFGVGNLQLSPVVGTTADTVTIAASGFTANSAVTIVFGGNPATDAISLPSGTTFDSSGFFSTTIKVPSNLGPGTYPVTVSDALGRRDTKPFNVVGSSAAFDVNVSAQFFPPVVQGQSSSPATVTVRSLPGKTAGTVTLTVLGLPPGVTVAFDGTAASGTPPTKTLTLGTGSSSSTSLTLNVAQSAPPGGSYFTTLQVSDGTTTRIINIGFGVIPSGALANNFGRLFVSPLAGQANEPITISATGFTPNSAVSLTFGTSTINVGGATFDSAGSFSTTIKVPPRSAPAFILSRCLMPQAGQMYACST